MPAKGHVPQECRHAFCRIQNNHADVPKALELQAAKCFLCCAGPNLMAHEHRPVGPLAFSTLQLRYSSIVCDAEWLAVHSVTGFVSSVVTFSAMSSIGPVALRTIEASSSKSFGPKPLGSTCLSAFHGPLASEKRLRPLRVDHDARGVFEPLRNGLDRDRARLLSPSAFIEELHQLFAKSQQVVRRYLMPCLSRRCSW